MSKHHRDLWVFIALTLALLALMAGIVTAGLWAFRLFVLNVLVVPLMWLALTIQP